MQLIHSEILGRQKPMMIIHGYFGMGENWKTMAKRFSADYEVHLVDLRNHGRSFHSEAFSYDLMVEDLLNYINHHQLSNMALIGHSMGGKAAMLLAASYPEYFEKLVVADIAPKYYPPHHQDILKVLNQVDFETVESRKDVQVMLSKHLENPVVVAFFLKSLYKVDEDTYAFRFNLDSLTRNNPQVGKAMLSEDVRFYKPTLFVRGENSDYIQKSDYHIIKNHFTNASIQSIPNSGHWLHIEKPDLFYELASKFLSKVE